MRLHAADKKSTIFELADPGPNISAYPIDLSFEASSSGMPPSIF